MVLSEWKFSKDEIAVRHGAVVAHHRLAAQSGLEMLQRGGNAVDAAVTAALVMSVLEPFMSGVGGGGYMVVHLADRRETLVVDFSMQTPAAATPDMFESELEPEPAANPWTFRRVKGDVNKDSIRAACLPGEISGLMMALERFGIKSRRDVMAPAIKLARDGFPMHWFLALEIYNSLGRLQQLPDTAAVFMKGTDSYHAPVLETAGDLLRQPDLAGTLEAVAEGGADAYYKGQTARCIVDFVQAKGGLLTLEDFSAYSARIVPARRSSYRSVEAALVPDICAGDTVAQMLNLLERFDMAALGHNSPDSLHLIAECTRRAWMDRFAYFGDPEHAAVPYDGLLSKEYAAARAAEISMDRATPNVGPGDPWPYSRTVRPTSWTEGRAGSGGGDTTHISVADEARNMVSMTKTASHFIVPGTGVMMNMGLRWFDPEPGHPNSIAGGKRLLNNMSPMMLLRNGRAFAAYGSPGARRIANALTHVAMNLLDYGMGIQDAVSAPKLDCSTPLTIIDDRIPEQVRAELDRRGHRLLPVHEDMGYMNFARPNGVVVDEEAGVLRAGSYPFFHGVAAGF